LDHISNVSLPVLLNEEPNLAQSQMNCDWALPSTDGLAMAQHNKPTPKAPPRSNGGSAEHCPVTTKSLRSTF
jgi:hypothetical protein